MDAEKKQLKNSKGNILCNSISVDKKIYDLHLKQRSNTIAFHGILRNFRTSTFENNFWGLLLKRKQGRRRERSDHCGFPAVLKNR